MDIQFSYLSRKVNGAVLKFREVNERQARIGNYGVASIDVFSAYYFSRKARRPGPHYEFANSKATPDAIKAFTARWGHLGFSTIIAGTPLARQFEPGESFFIFVDEWIEAQDHFCEMLQQAKSTNRQVRRKLAELFEARGSLSYLTINSSTSATINWEATGTLRIALRAGNLFEAFCLMLMLDLARSSARVVQCADPKCGQYFVAERSDKKFCSANHASRFAKRKWARKQQRRSRRRTRSGDQQKRT